MSRITLRSFVAGELDPALHQRVDLSKYATGLATCRNFFMRAQGGAYNRAGTRFIGKVKDSSKRTRLIPFQFNTEQTYILEFGHLVMRVIKDGAYVLRTVEPNIGTIYEIVTPYTEADLFDTVEQTYMLQFTQTADVMTITHRNHPVKELSRLGHDNWTLADVVFASNLTPPQLVANVKNITGISKGGGGVLTVTSAAHGFPVDRMVLIKDVGGMTQVNDQYFRTGDVTTNTFTLRDPTTGDYIDGSGYGTYTSGGTAERGIMTNVGSGAGTYNKMYRYVVTLTDKTGVESLQSLEASYNSKSLSQTFGLRFEWAANANAAFYTVYKDTANGTGVYGFIGETKQTMYEDYNIAPDTSRTPPEENTPISTPTNYPATVGFYQQRRIFGNTWNKPQTVFCTQIGIFNSLRQSSPTRADDGIEYTINSRQVNEVRHIVDLEDLLLLTAGAEYRVTEGQDFVLTPTTIGAKAQSYYGASWVRPATVGNSVVYVQEKGNRLRSLDFDISEARYKGNDLSVMSEHLFRNRSVVEMDYSAEPYGILWCVMSDGTLLGLTFQKEHEVWGWHRHDTDGEFESVAVVREGDRDAVYFIVKRVIDGDVVRYVERLESRIDTDAAEAFFVDCGLSYDGEPTTTLVGLEHLEGEVVVALADGMVVPDLEVLDGTVTLAVPARRVHVGLPYVSEIQTLVLDDAQTTLQGRKKNVAELILRVLSSRGGWAGPALDRMLEIKPRYDSDGYDPIELKTFEQRISVTPDWNDEGQIIIQQRDPLPLAITAITPEFDIGG